MRDAVMLFTQALKDMPKNFTTKEVDCMVTDETWEFGTQFIEKMKSVNQIGMRNKKLYIETFFYNKISYSFT